MIYNKTVIELEEFNQHKILNLLKDEKIKVLDFMKNSNKMSRLTIAKKDSEKTFAIFEKMCYTYHVVINQGPSDVFKKIRSRIGLIVGVVLVIALIVLFKGFIWRIEITGNDKLSVEEIEYALNKMDVGVGKTIRGVDRKSVELRLMEMDVVAGCSVSIDGTRLRVQILEKSDPPKEKPVEKLLSGYDAVVTRMIVDAGTAKVRIGDIVKKGEELISGVICGTDGLPIGQVKPKGEVYGKVVFTYSRILTSESIKFVRTGRSYSETKIRFFNLTPKFNCRYSSYESVKNISQMTNSILPLQFERVTYYETKPETVTFDIQELIESLKAEVRQTLVFNKGGTIIGEKMESRELTGNETRVDIFIEAEMLL